ncbi:hypothetical protein G6F43_012326 [Rhizopus delemar]|nr:hypothetical protein G6F43_012326 [Rhizopus delemar]
MTNEPDNSTNPPAWASILLERFEQLEARFSSASFLSDDPNVVIRTPGSEFTPSVDMVQQHSYITEDFFRRPLDDSQRRRYLFECPKNALRQYDPQSSTRFNSINRLNSWIHSYTKSSIAFPDLHAPWIGLHINYYKTNGTMLHFSYSQRILLSNVYRGIPGHVEAPPYSKDNLFLDPTEMVEHIKLQRTIQQATTQQPSSNRKRNNRHRSNRSARGDASNYSSSPNNTSGGDSSSPKGNNNSEPVGGRLTVFSSSWSTSLGFPLHPWLHRILTHGYRIPLSSPPPLRLPSTSPQSQTSNSTSTLQVIDQEIITLLKKQAIEPALSTTSGFQSTLFVIPKKDGGLRPVLNLKPLNQHLPVQHFKMETMKTITQLLHPGDYLTSIDLKDAFHHIAIHPASRHPLRFQWRHQVYQYRVLPLAK